MSKKTDISEDDMALFREMVGEVTPVKQDQTVHESPKPKAKPLQKMADDKQVFEDMLSDHHGHLETGEELSYHQPGLQKSVLKKLRRGQYAIERELDLHGYRTEEARQALGLFIKECRDLNIRCIRIIHGRALHKADGPVLKPLVNSWLRQKGDVLAFCSARPNDGGNGAVYALLKSNIKD